MKRSLFALFALAGLLSGGFLLLDEIGASGRPDVREEWVNANLMMVQVHGQWQEVPLMPLADHMCRSKNPLFEKHCSDDVLAPGGR